MGLPPRPEQGPHREPLPGLEFSMHSPLPWELPRGLSELRGVGLQPPPPPQSRFSQFYEGLEARAKGFLCSRQGWGGQREEKGLLVKSSSGTSGLLLVSGPMAVPGQEPAV